MRNIKLKAIAHDATVQRQLFSNHAATADEVIERMHLTKVELLLTEITQLQEQISVLQHHFGHIADAVNAALGKDS